VQRTQPWLGTLVTLGVQGASARQCDDFFRRAFAAIAAVHDLMSFHAPRSDVSRLNREAWLRPVAVDARTLTVLRLARRISAASAGVFDITVAPALVSSGFLPRPAGAPEPDKGATWRDITLQNDGRVRFRKPLWIDLGGIAKGFAVDNALSCWARRPRVSVSINAGGDLRVAGPGRTEVLLNVAAQNLSRVPLVVLTNRALASSYGQPARRRRNGAWASPHRHGATHRNLSTTRFVSVVARHCALADALTKVVLARGSAAAPVLRNFNAQAFVHNPPRGWQGIGKAR
jgi:thiamine biosynthesis lipoprotein